MPFQGLQSVLRQIEQQYQSPAQRHWRCLVEIWPQVVGAQLAQQTRPVNLRSQTLVVAVAHPVIVQTLMFERSRLLKTLNLQLAQWQTSQPAADFGPTEIVDLQLSTRGWHQPQTIASPYNQFNRWEQHPCRIPTVAPVSTPVQINLWPAPQTAFQQWATHMRDRHQALPLCPNCGGPTLSGELDRWGYCSLCYAQSHAPQAQGYVVTPQSETDT